MAYEWLFNGMNDYKKLVISKDTDYNIKRTMVEGTLTEDQIAISDELSAMFPEYVNSLGITAADGTLLTLDAEGNGSFKKYLTSYVIASAQKALDSGTDLSPLTWITLKDGTVTDLDFDQYLAYVGRMKTPSAFDGLDLSNAENELFGTAAANVQHFTQFGLENSTVEGTLADAALVKMMNPMYYIGTEGATTAANWRIRQGTSDNDTSIAVPAILAAALENKGYSVDFALPWGQGHGGDYDLEELFAWMDEISAAPSQAVVSAAPTTSSVMVDGKPAAMDAYHLDGSNYVKLRDLAAVLSGTDKQFNVTWDGAANAISLTSNEAYTAAAGELSASGNRASAPMKAAASDSTLYVNGQAVRMTAYLIDGSTYFKLRDVAKVIDFNVTWNGDTNTIAVDPSSSYKEEESE
ncbi:subtype B tannase [Paenibacillus sp. S-38]|uniref:subtype B tannase n=1 Tax=Paenibacillus sp. S-38 TaxID=3416710 RepID=UPI003CFAA70B